MRINKRIAKLKAFKTKLLIKHSIKISALAAIACSSISNASDLVLSGVIDGPLPGGVPKAIQVYVVNDIDDLSRCGVGSANNGGGSDGEEFTFPAVTANAGDYIYVASESVSFNEFFGFNPNYTSSAANINGDDAIELFCDSTVVDVFGDINVDGNGEVWEYLDGWAQRVVETGPDGNVFVDTSWQYSGKNALDGETSNAEAEIPFPLGTVVDEGDSDSDGEVALELGSCSDEANLISAIQGSGFTSPVAGESQVIEAVVTASFAHLNGFFLQEQVEDMDDDQNTSEGILVISETLPENGRLMRVLGTVGESYNRTQLVASDMLDCGEASTDVVALTLPFSAQISAEALEGMYVNVSQTLTVTNSYYLSRYGELTLSSGLRFNPTNLYTPNSEQAVALAATNELNQVILDDAVSESNPESIIYPTGGLTADNTVRLGDEVSSIAGILDYSYSSYRIYPTQTPQFNHANARNSLAGIVNGNITVASMNVLNFFNGDGQGGEFPTARGADTAVEFERQIAKILAAITAIDADIVGLIEIENDGVDEHSALVNLVARLNVIEGENTYDFVNAGGELGTDAIAVAFIFKPATVSLVGDAMINDNAIFNRPALAQTFALTSNNEQLTVIVNHFKSKGGCSSATGDDEDQNDGQACYNARRVEQATELVNWVNMDENLSQQTNVLVMGDLNAYAKEDPISYFTDNGYQNLINRFSGEQAYSYSYSGEVGYLDHALANAALAEKAVDAIEWHINADEPVALDYNTEYKSDQQIIDLYAADAFRMSDHDPVIVTFDLTSAVVVGDWDGDADVDSNDVRALILAIQGKVTIDMAFDLNGDSTVNILDARAMMSLCTRARCAL